MKRDMDLVRAILLHFEAAEKPRLSSKSLVLDGWNAEQITFHVELMKEAELLDHQIVRPEFGDGTRMHAAFDMGLRPTMRGYELLDSIRDPDVWRKTKEAGTKIGGAGVELLWEIAKGIAKQQMKSKLGIDIG